MTSALVIGQSASKHKLAVPNKLTHIQNIIRDIPRARGEIIFYELFGFWKDNFLKARERQHD